MSRNKSLTRDQLSKFLPSHEAIKAWEQLKGNTEDNSEAVEVSFNLAASASASINSLDTDSRRDKSARVLLWLSI